jgi:endonuclease III-like uncharacterized protein
MLMKGQLVDFHGSVLLSILGIGLMLLLYMYVHNFFFIKKNSKELSERIYGIEEYLDEVGVSFEQVLQLNFIFSFMWFSYFIEYRYFKRMSYFVKRGKKSPNLYPNLYQDNVIYLCEKFKKQIIINEVLSLFTFIFGIAFFSMSLLLIF